jgi:Holliday junction resolvasome RuvABC endonuclease subunit
MFILSIDASTKATGWAIFNDHELVDYGMVTATSTDLIKRLHKITNDLKPIIEKYDIKKVILEEVRPEMGTQNIKTHRALMWLQGALATMLHDDYKFSLDDIVYLYPSEWRKVCGIKTGSGVRRESLKPKDIAFVKQTYNINVNDDIADAIGIGYAYAKTNLNRLEWG